MFRQAFFSLAAVAALCMSHSASAQPPVAVLAQPPMAQVPVVGPVAPVYQQPVLAAPAPGIVAAPYPQPTFAAPVPVASPLPPAILAGPGNVLTQGIPVPPQGAPLSGAIAQPTVAVTNLYGPQPIVGQQTQIYTPTYYYYYYQQPSYVPVAPIAPMVAPVMFGDPSGGMMPTAGQFGPMSNARGEMGHVRYPYYSYRRPWYFPGQPSFNVTIDGPVW